MRYSPDHLDRGPLLLWPFEYWNDAYAAVRRKALLGVLVGFPVLSFPVSIFFYPTLYVLLLGYVALVVYYLGMHLRTVSDLSWGGAVPGIYREGLELPMFPMYMTRTFIPWGEIEDVFVSRGIISETLMVAIKGSRWRWRFPKAILGDEGVAFIMDRVRPSVELPPPLEPAVAPKLVVYGTRGGKMESVPDGEKR
jgi:hypothetical protein